MVDSTEKLSREDRKLLEKKVDIHIERKVKSTGKKIPEDLEYKEPVSPGDRTKALIQKYDDYIAEIDKILLELSQRCKGLVYTIDPATEYDCSAAIEALFEGVKTSMSYADYVKVLTLEAQLSREIVAEGGKLDGVRVPR